jgi:hypothetical protein
MNNTRGVNLMKIIETAVYNFEELNDKAKEKARKWWMEISASDDWHEFTYEDAEEVGLQITAFDLDGRGYCKGHIFTSAPECAEYITENHGKNCSTHATAQKYLAALKVLGDSCDAECGSEERTAWEETRAEIDQNFERGLLGDYLKMLRDEYEERNSNEFIDDAITANEYTFTIDGKRFG